MGNFSFSATAQCDKCGNFLSSSSEECDHDGQEPKPQFFRRITSSDDEAKTIVIEATVQWAWYALARQEGEDWIAYEWLGPRSQVNAMLDGSTWEDVDDLPKRAMSLDAPSDVMDEVES